MKTYKGKLNLPTHMTSEHQSDLLNRKLKILGLTYDAFIDKYEFVAVRTLRGHLVEAIFPFAMGCILYTLLTLFIAALDQSHYILAVVVVVLALVSAYHLRNNARTYDQTSAEYYIDIQKRV